MVWDHEAGGSNPLTPTIDIDWKHPRYLYTEAKFHISADIVLGSAIHFNHLAGITTAVDNLLKTYGTDFRVL